MALGTTQWLCNGETFQELTPGPNEGKEEWPSMPSSLSHTEKNQSKTCERSCYFCPTSTWLRHFGGKPHFLSSPGTSPSPTAWQPGGRVSQEAPLGARDPGEANREPTSWRGARRMVTHLGVIRPDGGAGETVPCVLAATSSSWSFLWPDCSS